MVDGQEEAIIITGQISRRTKHAGSSFRWVDPTEAGLREQWIRCTARSPGACGAILHPDLFCGGAKHRLREARLLSEWEQNHNEAEKLTSLAVLASKTAFLRVLPGIPLFAQLSGYVLVDDQVIGANTAAEATRAIDEVVQLLRRKEAECILSDDDIEIGSPLHEAFTKPRPGVFVHEWTRQPRWKIIFPPSPADYWKKFSSKTRYNMRREAKRLHHSVLCFESAEDSPRFLELAEQIYRASWKPTQFGIRVTQNEFQKSFWKKLAEFGAMRAYVMQHNERPIAFVLGTQWNGKYNLTDLAYNAEFAGLSPGKVLLTHVIEDLTSRNTPRIFDMGFGDSEYKRLFGNSQSLSAPMMLVRANFKNRLYVAMDRFARGIDDFVRTRLSATTLYRRLRRNSRRRREAP